MLLTADFGERFGGNKKQGAMDDFGRRERHGAACVLGGPWRVT